MTFKIEKNVDLPRAAVTARRSKYPFADMVDGDSFLVPVEEGDSTQRVQTTLCAAASHHAKKYGGKFITRKVEGGVRIWRKAGAA